MNADEFLKIARTDPGQIIETLFQIEDKNAQVVPFKFNNVQQDFYQLWKKAINGDIRAMFDILKARQQGFSSLILALYTVDFLTTPNIWCVCVSHETKATQRLFRKVHMYLQRLPFSVPLDISTKDMIVNKDNGAVFYIGTAGSKTFGQGDTIHRLHLSELSRYRDPETLLKNILPAVPPNGIIVKETTANGMGNYHHREWVKEKAGQSPFMPFFSPWFASKEYMTNPDDLLAISTSEKQLMEQYGLSKGQIYWRRLKIQELGSEDSFREQYPATDLEAFISSGATAFDKTSLAWFYENTVRDPIIRGSFDESASPVFVPDDKGYLKIWEKPLPNSHYFISADIGKSGDFCAATVMHWGRNEQVATIHGHFEPDFFGRLLYKLGAWYNYAHLIPERNGIGAATVATLRILEYPHLHAEKDLAQDKQNVEYTNYGMETNVRTRPLFISAGQKSIRDRLCVIRDGDYILELQSFKRTRDGRYEGVSDSEGVAHDDRVMAFLIGQFFVQTQTMPDWAGFNRVPPMAQPDSMTQHQASSMTEGGNSGFDDFT